MTLRFTPLAAAMAAAFGISVLIHIPSIAQQTVNVRTAQETQLPAVTVTAEVPESAQHLTTKIQRGALGSRSQLDTPFSSSVVKSEDLQERQVTKLGEVFALDASVSDNSGAYTSWASYVTVRGLPLDWQNSYRIDGHPFMSYATTLPYQHFEQIELLKGLSGFMYGFAQPGGMVNYVTKKPTETPVRSVEVGYQSDSIWREHVDLGGRFGNDDMFGYRLNAGHDAGDTFYDGKIKRDSLSLALDARLTRDLTWTFNTLYQKSEANDHPPSVFLTNYTGNNLPHAIRGDNTNLIGSGLFLDTELQYYSTGLRYQLAPAWTLSANASYSTSARTRNEGSAYLSDASGAYNDYRSDSDEYHRFNYYTAMLEGNFTTGSLEHQLNLGASWQKQFNDYTANSFYGSIGSGNIYQQNTNSYASPDNLYRYRNSEIDQNALFVSDTIKLSDRWSVLVGLRRTQFEQTSYQIDGTQSGPSYDKSTTTPTVAIMFKPQPDTTLYASYVESMEPGSIVSTSYANRDELLDPLMSKQYEAGIKTEKARWSATAAVFRIERGAEYADASNALVQDGEEIYQGLELGGSVRLGSQWDLLGNMMFLDSSYGKGNANLDNRVNGAPEFTAAAQLSYRVAQLPGLKLMADAKYTGDVKANAANTLTVPGYTLLNVGASYVTHVAGKETTIRAAIHNLTDKEAWQYQYANWIAPVDPRTFSVSVKVNF